MNETEIIQKHNGMIHQIAKKYRYFQNEYEDVIQELRLKAIEACRKFNESKKVKFSSFLFKCLSNRALRLAQDEWRSCKRINNNTERLPYRIEQFLTNDIGNISHKDNEAYDVYLQLCIKDKNIENFELKDIIEKASKKMSNEEKLILIGKLKSLKTKEIKIKLQNILKINHSITMINNIYNSRIKPIIRELYKNIENNVYNGLKGGEMKISEQKIKASEMKFDTYYLSGRNATSVIKLVNHYDNYVIVKNCITNNEIKVKHDYLLYLADENKVKQYLNSNIIQKEVKKMDNLYGKLKDLIAPLGLTEELKKSYAKWTMTINNKKITIFTANSHNNLKNINIQSTEKVKQFPKAKDRGLSKLSFEIPVNENNVQQIADLIADAKKRLE